MLDNFNNFIFVITIINVLVDFFVNNTILYKVFVSFVVASCSLPIRSVQLYPKANRVSIIIINIINSGSVLL